MKFPMVMRTILFLLSFNQILFSMELKTTDDLAGLIKNLTQAFERLANDGNTTNNIAQEYFEFIKSHWDSLEPQIMALAQFPYAIEQLANAVEDALPAMEACSIIIAGAIVASSLICVLPQIIKHIKKRWYKDPIIGLQ